MTLQIDRRVAGVSRYVLADNPVPRMLIPNEFRKCVMFIGYRTDEGEYRPRGTAFCVSVPGRVREFNYLVTARHNLVRAQKRGGPVLRVNSSEDACEIPCEIGQWVHHPDDGVDVSVMPLDESWEEQGIDIHPIDARSAITKDDFIEYEIGVGDEVFFTGLFVRHFGAKRNVPIVRVGNVALVADREETVQTEHPSIKTLVESVSYLIEVRSFGGLSGSPVFINLGGHRNRKRKTDGSLIFWLGLIHGHWNLSSEADQTTRAADSDEEDKLNSGIAVVVPVEQVIETLNLPALIEAREHAENELRAARAPVPD